MKNTQGKYTFVIDKELPGRTTKGASGEPLITLHYGALLNLIRENGAVLLGTCPDCDRIHIRTEFQHMELPNVDNEE